MPDTEALIVDDSMSARFALNRTLQPHNLNVSQAKTGEEGVTVAGDKPYDIIFMDHVLPGINGLEAMEQIRAMPQYTDTPIIMCTSNDDADYRAEALQRGATDVLCKPPDAQILAELLDKHLHAQASTTTDHEEPSETPSMSDSSQLQAIDERLDRLEAMLERLETTVSQMDARTKAVARAVADQAGRDLSNRLLRAVLTLKGK